MALEEPLESAIHIKRAKKPLCLLPLLFPRERREEPLPRRVQNDITVAERFAWQVPKEVSGRRTPGHYHGHLGTRVRACEIELCELDAEMCGGDASNAVSDAPRHDTSLAALPAILVVVGMLALLPAMTTLRFLGTRRSHSML